MYDELIKLLRNCSGTKAPCNGCSMYEDIACSDTLMRMAADAIEELSRQAKALEDVRPVVLCKDCKHSAHWYRDKSRCFLWHEDGIDVWDDGFCNYGMKMEEN